MNPNPYDPNLGDMARDAAGVVEREQRIIDLACMNAFRYGERCGKQASRRKHAIDLIYVALMGVVIGFLLAAWAWPHIQRCAR